MGAWFIQIDGHGCHHNKRSPSDADEMTRDFVDRLVKAGHSVTRMTFTQTGGQDDLTPSPEGKPRVYGDLRTVNG